MITMHSKEYIYYIEEILLRSALILLI